MMCTLRALQPVTPRVNPCQRKPTENNTQDHPRARVVDVWSSIGAPSRDTAG